VATPLQAAQLVRKCQHYSRRVRVSDGAFQMGKACVIFMEPGANVNIEYNCQNALGDGLLADICTRC